MRKGLIRSCSVVTLALAMNCPAVLAHETPASPRPVTPVEKATSILEIKGVVLQAIEACRTTPILSLHSRVGKNRDEWETPQDDKYLKAIQPVVVAGVTALPALRRLMVSAEADALQKRVARILIERIEHPEYFAALASYTIPLSAGKWAQFVPIKRAVSEPGLGEFAEYREKILEIDLIHPEARAAWQGYNEKVGIVRLKYERMPASQANWDAYQEELGLVQVQAADEFREAFTDRSMFKPRMNPQYFVAWEEVMLRPLPWVFKYKAAQYIMQREDFAVTPSLVEVVVQASKQEYSHRYPAARIVAEVLRWLTDRPVQETLIGLSTALQSVEANELGSMPWRIGNYLSNKPGWKQLLAQADQNAVVKPYLLPLQEAIAIYAEWDRRHKALKLTDNPIKTFG